MGGELIEIEKNAGYQAVLTYLKDYTKKVREIQEKYAFSNKDIWLTGKQRPPFEFLYHNLCAF